MRLDVWATSSLQPDVTLTVVGYGPMVFNPSGGKTGRYEFSQKNADIPGDTVTVTSSGGGTGVATVVFE